VTRDRRIGLVALGLGIVLIGLAQRIAPLTEPPLYDGLTVIKNYAWLFPPPGALGGAKGASGTAGLDHGTSPLIAISTPELTPQAQILATSGAMVLPPGTTSVKFSIKPILPAKLPTDGHIDGNVYRISVTNQAGVALTAPASALVTVVLLTPHSDSDRTMELDSGHGWQPLASQNQGPGTYLAVVTSFGDFAMVAPGAAPSPYPTATPVGGVASGAPASSGPSPAPEDSDLPSIGLIGGSPSVGPSQAPAAAGSSGGGIPLAPIGIAVVLILAVVVVLGSRGRRRPPPPAYRGAHRR